jgi:hypothetical protein
MMVSLSIASGIRGNYSHEKRRAMIPAGAGGQHQREFFDRYPEEEDGRS